MKLELYPLLFEPIFKDRIWGGNKLKSLLNKNIPNETIGESWELSSVEGDISIVKNGFLQGKSLLDLLEKYPIEILGEKVHRQFGNQFPLLFKFLDAKEDLSIQLHPNDTLAKKRHNSFGKTEMWYVMQADEGAKLIVGFKEDSSPEDYLKHLNDKSLVSILNEIPVKKGDVFFLETGTVHAIGAGTVIAEIQQTSDITYRLYDFDRKDAQGKTRELHIDMALEAINYKKVQTQVAYSTLSNQSNDVVECPYFTTRVLPLEGKVKKHNNGDSFMVYMCTEGDFSIVYNQQEQSFTKGDTVLLPAIISDYQIVGQAMLLEITIS
ncbi:class I mannose-6-phosphate isomerase [Flavobacterium amnicola]|uniref:Phosphohexomutase n=1 Tax=Flavobacterium amnicola TaxID=2506422 RepID=A0A4Q1K498_9FLAO|nr:type I phosphomannose isomerase catalytic subunit [Flavobacterium amnicola]RXR20372.1 class I mannose-6-phosphate isomerase [Flavobacterium amnicola]